MTKQRQHNPFFSMISATNGLQVHKKAIQALVFASMDLPEVDILKPHRCTDRSKEAYFTDIPLGGGEEVAVREFNRYLRQLSGGAYRGVIRYRGPRKGPRKGTVEVVFIESTAPIC